MTKYNSIENADLFIKEQIAWAKANNYKDFTIWSNGKDLHAILDDKDLALSFQRADLKQKGYWKAIIIKDGHRVEI